MAWLLLRVPIWQISRELRLFIPFRPVRKPSQVWRHTWNGSPLLCSSSSSSVTFTPEWDRSTLRFTESGVVDGLPLPLLWRSSSLAFSREWDKSTRTPLRLPGFNSVDSLT
jgi:hypothetical protein